MVNALEKMKAVGHMNITGTLRHGCELYQVDPNSHRQGRSASSPTAKSGLVKPILTRPRKPSTCLEGKLTSTIRTRARAQASCIPRPN